MILDDEADKILRSHTNFSIDWFTDNKMQSAFRVTSSKDRSEINNLVIDESVSADASKGIRKNEKYRIKKLIMFFFF